MQDAAIAGNNFHDYLQDLKNQQQDKDIADETEAREEADQNLQADINAKEEQSKDRDEQLQQNIDKEAQDRENADKNLQEDINAKEEQSKDRDEQLQSNIDRVEQNAIDSDTKLQGQINDLSDAAGAVSKEDLQQQYENTHYLNGVDSFAGADMKLDQAVYDVNKRVDNLENRVSDVEDRIDKVGAMAAAIANLHTMGYDPEAPTEIAVSVGQYKSETGMALGIFHYPNQDFMLSASISTSGDEVMGGIGATWKIGRKSAAEKAEIEEEKRLEKAEEMKQAAKENKVKAQRERHAKMLAEREAAGEPIRA
ncbi:YadA-like family protein [Megamonas sp.]